MPQKCLSGALVTMVVLSPGLMAQTTTTATPAFQTAVTSGMAGLAASQTAQLNALNTTLVGPGVAAIACPVELDFYDSQNRLLKSLDVANVSPGTSASLTLKLSEVPSASAVTLHTLVRGVVRTNPTSSLPPVPTPVSLPGGTLPPIFYAMGCNVFTTLEFFDSTSGVTQTFTSDTRPLPSVVPLATAPH